MADASMADAGALKERVRAAARAAGFDQVGFAPAVPPAHGEVYEAWLAKGYHGEMAYMAREDAVRRRIAEYRDVGIDTPILLPTGTAPGDAEGSMQTVLRCAPREGAG